MIARIFLTTLSFHILLIFVTFGKSKKKTLYKCRENFIAPRDFDNFYHLSGNFSAVHFCFRGHCPRRTFHCTPSTHAKCFGIEPQGVECFVNEVPNAIVFLSIRRTLHHSMASCRSPLIGRIRKENISKDPHSPLPHTDTFVYNSFQ